MKKKSLIFPIFLILCFGQLDLIPIAAQSPTSSSEEVVASSSEVISSSSSSEEVIPSSSTTSLPSSTETPGGTEPSQDSSTSSSNASSTSSSSVVGDEPSGTSTSESTEESQTQPSTAVGVAESASGQVAIYRLYNPSNGEHLYTIDLNEAKVLYTKHNWGYEGIGWYAPSKGTAVYRLYNAKLQNHLYTSDTNEVRVLTSRHGWTSDNNGRPVFYSGGNVKIYRVYNAKLRGLHHWTTDVNEYNTLPKHGWAQEGVKFAGVKNGSPIRTQYYAFELLSQQEMIFSVGVGGWRTYLRVKPDGTFSGQYTDYDYRDVYISDFTGTFSAPTKASSYEYHFTVEKLTYPAVDKVYYKGYYKYTTATPYGMYGGKNFLLYLPGRPTKDITDLAKSWVYDFNNINSRGVLTHYMLINNTKGQFAFYNP
ncbi:TPA: hypothetical protein ACGOON_000093 [Streptococcus suis]